MDRDLDCDRVGDLAGLGGVGDALQLVREGAAIFEIGLGGSSGVLRGPGIHGIEKGGSVDRRRAPPGYTPNRRWRVW